MMRDVKRVIEVSDYEHRVMMEALNDRRNDFISENKPTEDVSDLLLKVIDAPTKRKRDRDRDEEMVGFCRFVRSACCHLDVRFDCTVYRRRSSRYDSKTGGSFFSSAAFVMVRHHVPVCIDFLGGIRSCSLDLSLYQAQLSTARRTRFGKLGIGERVIREISSRAV